ncbi:MAG TPA: hypothetical protein DCZ92_15015 [Elusimicrobia bacterium]|nr:MAG: hypothetical protein A2016_10330 [Elusimicrobia bacterium GWF2_62_30]HBA62094.1 hypothetical protein [Elusimicrobiota bacterium]
MRSTGLKILAVLAFFCGLGFSVAAAAAGDGECKEVAAKIARFSAANGINRISVLGFTPKGGTEANETDYISEKLGAYLAGHKKPALIERALLEKVLKEARLSSAGNGESEMTTALRDIFHVDAVVTGTVFAAGTRLKVLTRLIDVKTGRVLLAAQSEEDREWAQFPELPAMDADWDAAAWPAPPTDLRDAISNSSGASCSGRKLRLTRLNSELVDDKARYWAAKMKEPGFSLRTLTRNPGTEITDPEVKARFYKLLGEYYRSDNPAPAGAAEGSALRNLLEEETQVHNECGYR